jgi:F-type H+-transporting ATPase subunit delta
MAETVTLARPYAKAIFKYALQAEKLKEWSVALQNVAEVILNAKTSAFIANPATTTHDHQKLILEILPTPPGLGEAYQNFISVLAENKRLMLLPDIFALFELLRAEQEKTLKVDLISFSEPTVSQLKKLTEALSKRLKREVTIQVTIDKSLIGGAIINAGDLVINDSIRDKLYKLNTELAA